MCSSNAYGIRESSHSPHRLTGHVGAGDGYLVLPGIIITEVEKLGTEYSTAEVRTMTEDILAKLKTLGMSPDQGRISLIERMIEETLNGQGKKLVE